MNRKDQAMWQMKIGPILLLLGATVFFPSYSYGKTAAEVLKDYDRLSEKERVAKLIEGAKREGRLVYYSGMVAEHMKRVIDEFNKKYPFITVGSYRSGGVNIYNKITTEALAKKYEVDVADLDPGEVYNLVKAGLVDPFISPSKKGIMEEFMDREGYWTAFFHLTVALAYNTKFVSKEEAPKNYEDLLDPKWKGRISLDTDDMNLMGTLVDYWGREKGLAYFRKLAANDPVMRRGKSLQAQTLVAGDVHVAPFLFGFQPAMLKQTGAPVEIVLLNPTLSHPSYLVLLKDAPRPHTAALFLDWALSQDGPMKIFAEEYGRGVPRQGYKGRFPELSVARYLVVAPEKIGPAYEEYRKTYCGIFKHC